MIFRFQQQETRSYRSTNIQVPATGYHKVQQHDIQVPATGDQMVQQQEYSGSSNRKPESTAAGIFSLQQLGSRKYIQQQEYSGSSNRGSESTAKGIFRFQQQKTRWYNSRNIHVPTTATDDQMVKYQEY